MKGLSKLILSLALIFIAPSISIAQRGNLSGNAQNKPMINAEFSYKKKYQRVYGLNMAYVEIGSGDPIVFLHGNPTSSYIWRNILPYTESLGRVIAPDLIGMGDSDKIPNPDPDSYKFVEQRKYLDQLLEQLGVAKNIIFVAHDWGAALAFDWAARHPEAVKGIAYMEAIILSETWEKMPDIFRDLLSAKGEQMVLEKNSFIEFNLQAMIIRPLTDEELNNYRAPFLMPGELRRAMLTWARELPYEGQPQDVTAIVKNYDDWLSKSKIPKLFIEADPGTMSLKAKAFCLSLSSQVHIKAKGRHNLQEDSPAEIGIAISAWLQTLNLAKDK